MPLVGQELPTLSEHLSLPPVFNGVRVTRSLVLCVCFVDRCCPFSLTIVLSVLLRFMDSNYPFGIFKLFLRCLSILNKAICKHVLMLKSKCEGNINYVGHDCPPKPRYFRHLM